MNKTLKRLSLMMMLATVCTQSWGIDRQTLINYAQSLKGKSKAELKSALHDLIQPKKILDYGSGNGHTWYGFYYSDRIASTNECINRYSNKKFYFPSNYKYSALSGMNIEHSFPKSWWGGAKNKAYQDLYHLYPSDSKANSSKSNYPMGIVTNVKSEDEGYDKVGTGTINGQDNVQCWEPGDSFKGDFSRTYFYMAVTYSNLTYEKTGLLTMSNESYPGLKPWASSLYIQWGKLDLIDATERARNNAVASIEGNRNLFIDFPNLADYIWGDSVDVAFNPETTITTADDDMRYMSVDPIIPDQPDEPNDSSAIIFKKTETITSGQTYLFVANNNGQLYAAAPVNNSGKEYGYLYGRKVVDKDGVISLPSDTLAFVLEESGDGYLIKDSKQRYLYHKGTYTSFNVSNDVSEASVWTFAKQDDNTFKITNSSDNYYIQYSAKYVSFGCYKDLQGVLPSLYIKENTADNIHFTHLDHSTVQTKVYNLQGQYLGNDIQHLPTGLYIINGKKLLIK